MPNTTANQNGAQGHGAAAQGNRNTINTGTQNNQRALSLDGGTVTGNVSVTNGLSATDFGTVVSSLLSPSASQVKSATPPDVTQPAPTTSPTATTGGTANRIVFWGCIAIALGGVFLLVRKFLK